MSNSAVSTRRNESWLGVRSRTYRHSQIVPKKCGRPRSVPKPGRPLPEPIRRYTTGINIQAEPTFSLDNAVDLGL